MSHSIQLHPSHDGRSLNHSPEVINGSRFDAATFSRRSFVQSGLACGLAAAAGPAFADPAVNVPDKKPADVKNSVVAKKPARHVIYVFMSGAPSQLETFDPKPGAPTGGPFGAIATKTPGFRFCEYLPRLTEMSDKFSVVRSVTAGGQSGDHAREIRYALTGHQAPASKFGIVRPSFGSLVARLLGSPQSKLPGYVCLSPSWHPSAFPGSGSLEATVDIMKCPGHGQAPGLLKPSSLVQADGMRARSELRERLSRQFAQDRAADRIERYETSFERARALMDSKGVFDLEQEPASIRERYGPTRYGRDALAARRMIEAGVPFVLIQCFGTRCDWDWHYDAFSTNSKYMLGVFDHVTTTLMRDLMERGLWDKTLLICGGEFGRTPDIGSNEAGGWGGRAHYGRNFCTMVGGGPIHGGLVLGATNAEGTAITERPVTVADMTRTHYAALGFKATDEFVLNGQPIPIQEEGEQTIHELLIS